MILRLVLGGRDFFGRVVHGGTVAKWLKTEGDRVDYGDDIVEIIVEEIRVPEVLGQLRAATSELEWDPPRMVALAGEQLRGTRPEAAEIDEERFRLLSLPNWCRMRLTASDTGILRQVLAKAGERHAAGQLLGVLTTNPEDALAASDPELQRAPRFRVVENFVPWQVEAEEDGAP